MTQCSLLQLACSMLVGKSKHESQCVKINRAGGGERKGQGEVFPLVSPQPSPVFNGGRVKIARKLSSAPVCCCQAAQQALKGGRGRRGTENWKDEVSTFFFPSLFPGLFTKFLGSCLISVENWERFSEAREVKNLIVTSHYYFSHSVCMSKTCSYRRNKKICSASSYQKYFAAWTLLMAAHVGSLATLSQQKVKQL